MNLPENQRNRFDPLIFPPFESLPATAGFTNLQAFQLGLRHALTLLPLRNINELNHVDAAAEIERFTLSDAAR